MLVVTRRAGDAVCIGEDVEITVLEVAGDRIKLGVSAPREIKVVRKELKEIARLNRQSALEDADAESLSYDFQLSATDAKLFSDGHDI